MVMVNGMETGNQLSTFIKVKGEEEGNWGLEKLYNIHLHSIIALSGSRNNKCIQFDA